MTCARNRTLATCRGAALVLCVVTAPVTAEAQDEEQLVLPDLIVREADLHEHDFVTDEEQRTWLRLNNGTANLGPGLFYIYGVIPDSPTETQEVVQRIFYPDFRYEDFAVGSFVYHPEHKHVHVEDWNVYRLREVLPNGDAGAIVSEGEKISYCIIDVAVYDRTLPNFAESPRFISCGSQTQGLSVGWVDVYTRNLPGQQIDVTDVPDGRYWLESVVDPLERFIEADDTNNFARILVTVGNPPAAPDPFEPNDSAGDPAFFRPGAPWSPNLGPCDPVRLVEGATIHVPADQDHYRFYMNTNGDAASVVHLEFAPGDGSLLLALLDQSGTEIARATAEGSPQSISLAGLPRGWYTARVFAAELAATPLPYTLTVVPPANAPPAVEVLDPPAGGALLIHGFHLYVVRWQFTDADDELAWVTLFVNEEPVLDGSEILLMTSLNTEAADGIAVMNTAELAPGTYWIFAEITDGGTTTGSWSRGPVTLIEVEEECSSGGLGDPQDCNANGVLDACEIAVSLEADCDGNVVPDRCDLLVRPSADADADGVLDTCQQAPFRRGDVNDDGDSDLSDAVATFGYLFLGSVAPHCVEAADTDNDAEVSISDGISLLNYLFRGTAPPAPPGAGPSCGKDPDPRGSAGDLGCAAFESCVAAEAAGG